MNDAGKLQVTTPSDREIAMTRVFDAPRRLVYEAWTKPALLKRWLLGPPGWTMVVCEVDMKAGGAYRYVWRRDTDGHQMGMGGVYREVVPMERFVATEKFDESWYPGGAVVTVTFDELGGKTTATTTVLYETREARDIALKSGMKDGVAMSYDRLAALLVSMPSQGAA